MRQFALLAVRRAIIDIGLLKELGYNMMRKHLKVEPARYYWLCAKMGIMVLQDMPNGGGDCFGRYHLYREEFKQVVDALRVFPSIVMWDPYNEGWGQPGAFFSARTVEWIKRYDRTRLVDGPSGWADEECDAADVVDVHSYPGPDVPPVHPNRIAFLGEFGGLPREHAANRHGIPKVVPLNRFAERPSESDTDGISVGAAFPVDSSSASFPPGRGFSPVA